MKYKITNFYADTGSALVKFYTDEFPDGLSYNVDIPIENGQYITGEALDQHILSFAPYGQIQRILDLRNIPAPELTIEPEELVIPDQILGASLESAKSYAERMIDAEASKTRAKFISVGAGQEATYIVKAEQAIAYKAANYSGEVPSYIAAEAAALGKTPVEVTDDIIATSNAWNNLVGPQIEALRIGGKSKVRAAATVEVVDTEFKSTVQALQQITP
jgi:hypothetical protein